MRQLVVQTQADPSYTPKLYRPKLHNPIKKGKKIFRRIISAYLIRGNEAGKAQKINFL